MRNRLATLLAGTIAGLCVPSAVFGQNFLDWHGNLAEAAKLSAKTGKPLFVVFRCVR